MSIRQESARKRRSRSTRLSVRISEHGSRLLITLGGFGTIAAVTLIFVFLTLVVLPLFTGARLSPPVETGVQGESADASPIHMAVDEYGVLASSLYPDGTVRVNELATGKELSAESVFAEAGAGAPTAWSISPIGESLAFGFADGSIRLATFGFSASFPAEDAIPPELRDLPLEGSAVWSGGILQRTPEGKFRLQRFRFHMDDALRTSAGSGILRLAHIADDDGAVFCAWTADSRVRYFRTEEEMDLMTGDTRRKLDEYELAYAEDPLRGPPRTLLLSGIGDNVLLIWKDGATERLDARNPNATVVAETLDLVPEDGAELTATTFLVGHSTIVTGDSDGAIRAWFGTKPEGADTRDGTVFVMGHELRSSGPAVTSLSPAPRSRMLVAGFEDGSIELLQATTNQVLARGRTPSGGAVRTVRILPKEDAIAALDAEGITRWKLDPRYPEVSLSSLFTPVWYEGYPRPEYAWQTVSSSDDFEPKYSFIPLIYGTLKATFYSMIFGAPLALLAAIFTSEFLSRRLRVPIKSTIEMMASLPSVVLGFLAGIVIAPFAQKILPATLAIFATLPFALLAGAYAWQLLPQKAAIRWSGLPKLVCIAVALPIGIAAALYCGPVVERVFFAGNMELWLDGQVGNAVGGWMMLLLPISAVLAIVIGGRYFGAWMRAHAAEWSRTRCAVADIVKFTGGTLLTVLFALGISWGLDLLGLDPRGTYVDTYVQRNALVVGFVMGFAVIPIIYTLAEDALTSVPDHLRQASLGAGATPWQTAVRVVVPTAMSGLFSAVMIGFGRAVGETMIVLMATGNTPVMEMNVFNGFRTLSANIAVELPEAVQNSAHYRTLFMAALVLFAMTFALNTLAEAVRLRFRRRAYQL